MLTMRGELRRRPQGPEVRVHGRRRQQRGQLADGGLRQAGHGLRGLRPEGAHARCRRSWTPVPDDRRGDRRHHHADRRRGRRRCTGADVIYTDIWVSMGEPTELWAERIELLSPVPGQRKEAHGHGRPGRHLHALPALLPRPQHHHRRRTSPRSSACTEMEVDRRGVRVQAVQACSTRPRTACTPSRQSCTRPCLMSPAS